MDCRISGRHSRWDSRHRHPLRPVEYRHVVRIRPGLDRGNHPALQTAGTPSRVPRAWRARGTHPQRHVLLAAHGRVADSDLAALLLLADCRADRVHALQPPSHRIQPRRAQADAAGFDEAVTNPAPLNEPLEGTDSPSGYLVFRLNSASVGGSTVPS